MMTALTLTSKGQVTFKKDVLRHLGAKPGDRIAYDKLPGAQLRVKLVRPSNGIDNFIGLLASPKSKPLSIEQMNEIAANAWAGKP
jgi:antitoxin PrlF